MDTAVTTAATMCGTTQTARLCTVLPGLALPTARRSTSKGMTLQEKCSDVTPQHSSHYLHVQRYPRAHNCGLAPNNARVVVLLVVLLRRPLLLPL